jgi:uncharacterized YccA/Bax inhibitor family protein
MSNPLFNEDRWSQSGTSDNHMTVTGAIQKTAILLGILILTFGATWDSLATTSLIFGMSVMPVLIGSMIVAFVCALIGSFVPRAAMPVSIIYALVKGVLLGAVSYMFNQKFHGLPLLAATLTVGTLTGMLFLYTQRIIRASPMFIKCVAGATLGLVIGVLLLSVLNLFGAANGITASLYGNGPIGIGFSLVCVGLAAFNLILDFHFIETGAANRAPKYMEWVSALALLITLVWLYLEILRLLSKLQSRD